MRPAWFSLFNLDLPTFTNKDMEKLGKWSQLARKTACHQCDAIVKKENATLG